jgi:hypothetical protein
MTENSDGNQLASAKPSQFQPGQSGNPAGKPNGARHAATLAAEALLDGEAEALTRKCVELAFERASRIHRGHTSHRDLRDNGAPLDQRAPTDLWPGSDV